ncbi:hypothetical protein Btru_033418 [Bulinus truncatus]|nr:hypothetical protein Btru_033418 [Bulinus truncatus]
MQPRPPSSSERSSGGSRPVSSSSRVRSAMRKSIDLNDQSHEVFSETVITRPPSSFSKYRLLPAIGSPSPTHLDEPLQAITPVPPNNSQIKKERQQIDSDKYNSYQYLHEDSKESNSTLSLRLNSSTTDQQTSSALQNNVSLALVGIEKLDLSQLDKPPHSSRRRKSISIDSPSHAKHKNLTHEKYKNKNGELYDADDDDSDSSETSVGKIITQSKPIIKKPVIIPSPDNYPTKDILLAVKLPSDGTRHQRYFSSKENLQSILDFAEDVAKQDFGGYILVSSAPRMVYKDLYVTIEHSGLQDKSVLHLEEAD